MNDFTTNIHVAEIKSRIRADEKLYVESQKMLLQEAEREQRKRQVEIIKIDSDGIVYTETTNLRIKSDKRCACNFIFPKITVIERLENRYAKAFLFDFVICGEERWTILLPEKCGSGSYVLRKINCIGGEIFAGSQAAKKQFAINLIARCSAEASSRLVIPDERGWIEDQDGRVRFFNGKLTWKEVCKCAK